MTMMLDDVKIPSWRPKMIVLDKDGTLGDCSAALSNWCQRMSSCIYEECERSFLNTDKILEAFHKTIGWNIIENDLMPSALLSAGTWTDILNATIGCLEIFGVVDASQKVKYWHENMGDIHANDRPLIPDLPGFVEYFRELGMIVAICTSDDRRATDACIRNWNLENLIDLSICGDEVVESKPSSHPLMALCKQAGVSPQECIVVGDTSADMGMGRNSNAGLIVGVLSGSGTANHLFEKGAHLVVPDVSYLVGITSMFSASRQSSSHTSPAAGNNISKSRTVSL